MLRIAYKLRAVVPDDILMTDVVRRIAPRVRFRDGVDRAFARIAFGTLTPHHTPRTHSRRARPFIAHPSLMKKARAVA